MSNLNLPDLHFDALRALGLQEGDERKLAYQTWVRLGRYDGDLGFIIRHHRSDIAFIGADFIVMHAWHSMTTAARLNKVLLDNSRFDSPWRIGIKQGMTELRNMVDRSQNQWVSMVTLNRRTGMVGVA